MHIVLTCFCPEIVGLIARAVCSEVLVVIRALALRDYYPFWKHRNERSRAGKLLLLDPSDHSTIQARALRLLRARLV